MLSDCALPLSEEDTSGPCPGTLDQDHILKIRFPYDPFKYSPNIFVTNNHVLRNTSKVTSRTPVTTLV
jgi:hypothetical protein